MLSRVHLCARAYKDIERVCFEDSEFGSYSNNMNTAYKQTEETHTIELIR